MKAYSMKMMCLKNNLVLTIIAICILKCDSYTFNEMITRKNPFSCNKKCNKCVFNKYKTLPINKNLTDIYESEKENDLFIQEGEINIMD